MNQRAVLNSDSPDGAGYLPTLATKNLGTPVQLENPQFCQTPNTAHLQPQKLTTANPVLIGRDFDVTIQQRDAKIMATSRAAKQVIDNWSPKAPPRTNQQHNPKPIGFPTDPRNTVQSHIQQRHMQQQTYPEQRIAGNKRAPQNFVSNNMNTSDDSEALVTTKEVINKQQLALEVKRRQVQKKKESQMIHKRILDMQNKLIAQNEMLLEEQKQNEILRRQQLDLLSHKAREFAKEEQEKQAEIALLKMKEDLEDDRVPYPPPDAHPKLTWARKVAPKVRPTPLCLGHGNCPPIPGFTVPEQFMKSKADYEEYFKAMTNFLMEEHNRLYHTGPGPRPEIEKKKELPQPSPTPKPQINISFLKPVRTVNGGIDVREKTYERYSDSGNNRKSRKRNKTRKSESISTTSAACKCSGSQIDVPLNTSDFC